MQNWETVQSSASYVDPNSWYNNMFAANIKTEPGTMNSNTEHQQPLEHSAQQPVQEMVSSDGHVSNGNIGTGSHVDSYLKQQQLPQIQQQQQQPQQNQQQLQQIQEQVQQQPSDQQHEQQPHKELDQQQQQQIYQQHFLQAQQSAAQNQISSQISLGFNPLTPPGLPNAVLPPMPSFYQQNSMPSNQQSTSPVSGSSNGAEQEEKGAILTPRHTPPMDITPPKSPKPIASSLVESQLIEKEDPDLISNSSEDLKQMNASEYDEYIRTPIYNSHGKMKTHKCKTCGLVSLTKVAFWEHTRTHENAEKILLCPKCPFWAKVKHHLEFHICKHKNLKPFECDKCDYSCENKSMLASHRKKHSSVYQYRCADCDYATKFCHAFKQHLRKYEHKPGLVLDEEGVPNPAVIIDVYGTRRGPKSKSSTGNHCGKRLANGELKTPSASQLSAALQGFMANQNLASHLQQSTANNFAAASTADNSTPSNLEQQTANPIPANVTPNTNNSTTATADAAPSLPSILPPLDSILQQNHNMTLLSYWNLNLQMLAAQQHAVALAQISPQLCEEQQNKKLDLDCDNGESSDEYDEDSDHETYESNRNEPETKATIASSAPIMNLSQNTPTKNENWSEEQNQSEMNVRLVNLQKLTEGAKTPIGGIPSNNMGVSKRKGRVLNLDSDEQAAQAQPASAAVDNQNTDIPSSSKAATTVKEQSEQSTPKATTSANSSTSALPSTSVSSLSSTSSSSSSPSTASTSGSANGNSTQSVISGMFECKYCDIYFKDAVLYTIHMGYHSCDDVFKCNMCGEKCDGPVGLFVHMARNAHS